MNLVFHISENCSEVFPLSALVKEMLTGEIIHFKVVNVNLVKIKVQSLQKYFVH